MNVSVIGLGKLGLPLLALLANSGHKVVGLDQSLSLLESLDSGVCPYSEPGLSRLLDSGRPNIAYSHDLVQLVDHSEVVFIIVPTPSKSTGEFDNSILINVCLELGKSLRDLKKLITINIVSTVMPGSCENEIRKALETYSEMRVGEQLGLCYNPEFIALGSVIHDMQYPDMQLLGASSDIHAERVESVLKSITRKESPIRRMSLVEAELVKIAVNNFVTTKIAFANMLGQLSSEIGGIDIDVVTEAIGLDSRIGRKYLRAGTPFGGPCFPRDTKALAALAKRYGMGDSISKAVDQANSDFYDYLIRRISRQASGGRIGIVGLSYKPHTQVTEESPGIQILYYLATKGTIAFGWDPLVKDFNDELINERIIQDFSDFTNRVDIVYVTRPMPELNDGQLALLKETCTVIDFWREIK